MRAGLAAVVSVGEAVTGAGSMGVTGAESVGVTGAESVGVGVAANVEVASTPPVSCAVDATSVKVLLPLTPREVRSMARRLRPVELDFTASAPVRLVFTATLAAPPAAVYRSLAVEVGSTPSWFTALASAVPTGDGTGRSVRLRGGIALEETILAAEPRVRYAYRVDTTNAPGRPPWRRNGPSPPPGGHDAAVDDGRRRPGPVPARAAVRAAGPGAVVPGRGAPARPAAHSGQDPVARKLSIAAAYGAMSRPWAASQSSE